MLAYKECLACPPASPLDGLADVNVKVIEEREKRPRRSARAAEPVKPPPKPATPAAPEAIEYQPPPVSESRVTPPVAPVHHAPAHVEAPQQPAHKAVRATASASSSHRTRNLMIVLVLSACAFAASQYFFNYSGNQLSNADTAAQMKSNAEMVKMGVLKYRQDQKRFPASPDDVNSSLATLHMTLTSPYTGKPIKVTRPGAADANPGDIYYEGDGTHYKIRLAGQDKAPWTDGGMEFVATDTKQ